MSDLEISIALAKAMGWGKLNDLKNDSEVFCWRGDHWKIFEYHNPVVFVAICKRWQLNIDHQFMTACYSDDSTENTVYIRQKDGLSIERAAALCVIEVVKRGVK